MVSSYVIFQFVRDFGAIMQSSAFSHQRIQAARMTWNLHGGPSILSLDQSLADAAESRNLRSTACRVDLFQTLESTLLLPSASKCCFVEKFQRTLDQR